MLEHISVDTKELKPKVIKYDCDICKDNSMVLATKEDIENGVKTITSWSWETKSDLVYKLCQCELKRKFNDIMTRSGLDHLIDLKINDFIAKYDWQKNIKDNLYKFSNNHERCFFLSGQSGSGKTMAMSILFKNLVGKYGLQGRYLEWESFINEANNNYREIDKLEYANISNVPILYIDDFLKCPNNDINNISVNDLRYARNIINQRYKNDKLITLISTELTGDEIEQLDQSLHGRIFEMATSNYFMVIKPSKEKNIRVEKTKGAF